MVAEALSPEPMRPLPGHVLDDSPATGTAKLKQFIILVQQLNIICALSLPLDPTTR